MILTYKYYDLFLRRNAGYPPLVKSLNVTPWSAHAGITTIYRLNSYPVLSDC